MEPRVVVIGAGLAGLTCAYRLAHREVPVDVYESRDRIGGRCWSSGGWPDGQVIEHGGELIEDWQPHILALVEEFGLELEHRTLDGGSGVLIADGKAGSLAEITGLPKVLARIVEELGLIGDPTAAAPSDEASALDAMTQTAWLDANVDDLRLRDALGRLIAIIDGRSTDETSALAIHALLGNLASSGMELTDVARKGLNDLMHVRGGNDRIAKELAAGLPAGAPRLGSALLFAERTSDGFRLRFSDGTEADATRVALTSDALCVLSRDGRVRCRGAVLKPGVSTKDVRGHARAPPKGWVRVYP